MKKKNIQKGLDVEHWNLGKGKLILIRTSSKMNILLCNSIIRPFEFLIEEHIYQTPLIRVAQRRYLEEDNNTSF